MGKIQKCDRPIYRDNHIFVQQSDTHTLCLLEDKSLKILGLISITKKLYIKYKEIKVDMQLLHRQTVF